MERRTIRNCADIQITDRITRRKRQVQGWQNKHQDHTNLGKRVEWLGVQAKKTIDNHNAAKKPLVMKDAEIYRTELRKVESIAPKPSPPGIPNNNRQQYYQLQHQRALHRQNGQFGQQQNASPTRYAQHNTEIIGQKRHRPSNQNFKLTQDARPKQPKKNQVEPSPAFVNPDSNPKPTPTQANQRPTSQSQHPGPKQGDQFMHPHRKQHKPASMNQHNVQPTNQPMNQYQHGKHPNQPVYKPNAGHQQQYQSQFQQRRRQHQQQQHNQWYPRKQHHRQQAGFTNNNNKNGWTWNQNNNYQRMPRQRGSLSQTQNQPPKPSVSMDGVGGAFSSQFDKPSGGLSSMPSENPSKTQFNDMVAKTHSGGFLASQESLLPRSSNPNQQYHHNRRPPTPPSSGLYPSNDVVPSVSSGNSPLSNFKGDTPISIDRPAMEMNPDTKQIRNFVQPAGFKEIPRFDFVHAPEVQRERIKPKIIQNQSTTPSPSNPQRVANTGVKQPQTVNGNMGNQPWQNNGWQGFQPNPQPTPVQQPRSPQSPSLHLQSNTRSQPKQPPSSSPTDVPVKVQPNPQWLDSTFKQQGTKSNVQRISSQHGWMSNNAPTPTKTSVNGQNQKQSQRTNTRTQPQGNNPQQTQWQSNRQNTGSNTQPLKNRQQQQQQQQQIWNGQQQQQGSRQAQMRQIGEGQLPSPTASQQPPQNQQRYQNSQQIQNQQQNKQQQQQQQQELWKEHYLQAQSMRQGNPSPSVVPYSQNQQNNPSYRIRPNKKPFTLNADPQAMRWNPKVARQFFGGLTVYDPKPSSSSGFQKPKASPPSSRMFPTSTAAPVTTTPAPVQRVNRWNAPPAPASPVRPPQNQHSMMSNVPSQTNINTSPNFAQRQQFPNQQQQYPNQQQFPNQQQQQRQQFQNQQQQLQSIPSQNAQQSPQNTQQVRNQKQPPSQQAQNVAIQTTTTISTPIQNKGSKVLADTNVPGTKIKGINSPLFVLQSKADVNKHLDKTEAPPVTKATDKMLNIGEYNTGFKGNKNPLYVVGSPLMVSSKKSEPSKQIEIVPKQSSMVPNQPNSNNVMLNSQQNSISQHVVQSGQQQMPSTPAPQASEKISAPRSFNPFLGSPRPLPNRQRPTGPLGSQKGFPNQANKFGSLFVQGAVVTTSTPAPTTNNPFTTQGYRMGSLAAIGMGTQNLQGAVIAAAKATTPSPPVINARQETFSAHGRGMFRPTFTRKLPQRYPQRYPPRNVNNQRPIYPRVMQNTPPTALAQNQMPQVKTVQQTRNAANEQKQIKPQTGLSQQQSVASENVQPNRRGPPEKMTTLDAIIWDRAVPTTTESPITQAPYDPSKYNRFSNQNQNQKQNRFPQYPNVRRPTQNRFGNRQQQSNQYPQKPSLSNPMSSGTQLSNWKGPSKQYQGATRGQQSEPHHQWNKQPNNPNMFSVQNGQSQIPENKPRPVLIESPNTPAPTTGSRVNQFIVSGPKPPQRAQQQSQRSSNPQPAPIPIPVNRNPQQIKGRYPQKTVQKPGVYNPKTDTFGAFLMGGADHKTGVAAENQIEKHGPNLQTPVRKEYVEPSNTVSQLKQPNAIYPSHMRYPSNDGGFSVLSGGLSPSKIHPMAVSRAKERLQPSESPKLSDLGNVFGREQRAHRLGSYQNALQPAESMPSAGNSQVLWAVRTTPAESKIIYQEALQNQAIADKGKPVPGFYRRDTVVEKQPQSVVPSIETPRQQSLSNGPLPMELEKSRNSVRNQNPYPQPIPKPNNQPEPGQQQQRPVPKTIEAPVKMAVIDPPVKKQQILKEAPQQQLLEKQPAEVQQSTTTAKPDVRVQSNPRLYRAPEYHQRFRFRSTGFGIPQVRPASSKGPSNGAVQYAKSP